MMGNLAQERRKVLLIVSFGYIVPVVPICLGWVPFAWRFYLLILVAIAIFAIARLYRFSPQELGLTTQQLGNALKAIARPTLAFASVMLIYYAVQGARIDNSSYKCAFYLFFAIISSPIQEFLYRGFLFGIFARARLGVGWQILLSASLYSYIHLIYQDLPTLLLTLVMGLLWGCHYAKYRNLYSVILSHSLLGAIAILVGLV
ncbi:type II CAAX prenyl endopeptidase Rce1 family protein [Microseira sp. BLCC-F43]|uniref:CPBP family glutamic-type intramembrane protease n=1 Tax=Microseira sp. BLCC-F43 TaxID=3153602 RepID=UPI0035B7E6C5